MLLPVRDGQSTIGQAVESILSQRGVDLELIAIDDGSNDGTSAILDSFTDARLVRVTNPQSLGITASLNLGLRAAKSPLIARIDADDVAHPDRLMRQAAVLESADADIVFCRCRYIDSVSGREWTWQEHPAGLRDWRCLFSNYYGPHPSAMFRAALARKLGGYDETFQRGQDFDLWDRAAQQKARFFFLPETLMTCQILASSLSRVSHADQFAVGRIVSRRAMARHFPDMEDREWQGLFWLLFDRAPDTPEAAIECSIGLLEKRIAEFVQTSTSANLSLIRSDAAANIAARLLKLRGPTKLYAFLLGFRLALQSSNAIALLLLLKNGLFSR